MSWLKEARKAAGLTQQDLAKLIGKNQAQVSRMEAEPGQMTVERFLHICRELRLDPSQEISKL